MPVELCTICSPSGPVEEEQEARLTQLKKILPNDFLHNLCSNESLEGNNFKCILRLKLTTEVEAKKWLQAFQEASFMTWRILKTYPDAGRFNSYRVDLRCQHFSRPKAGTTRKKVGKDTQCPARMYLVVKRSQVTRRRKSRSRDEHIKNGFMFIINLRNEHNHDLLSSASLRNRDVSKETTDNLKALYQKGHTPSTALEILKHNLREEFSANYSHVLGDRSLCPDLNYCYRLYYRLAKQATKGASGADIYVNLEARLASYNEEYTDECAKMQQTKDGEVVISICTPLIKRVHTHLDLCGQVLFIDSSYNKEETKCYLFVLLAHSTAGGLPLGVIITSSEKESTLTAGLELLKTQLPDRAFGGRGTHGPEVAIMSDCLPLQRALHSVYPMTEFMLCEFQLLQSTWKWLWNDANKILPDDRPALLATTTAMVNSNSSEELMEKFTAAQSDDSLKEYTGFKVHLAEVFKRRNGWETCCYDRLLVLPEITLEVSKAAMHVFKDKILYKLKNYTLSQAVEFILGRFDVVYKRRLIEVINKKVTCLLNSKYVPLGRDLDCKAIAQVDSSHYTVPSLSDQQDHLVNTDIGTCTCPLGMKGGPCKHQHAVIKKFKLSGYLGTPIPPEQKSVYGVIASDQGKPIFKVEPVDEPPSSVTSAAVEADDDFPMPVTPTAGDSVEITVAQEIIAAATNLKALPKPTEDTSKTVQDHEDHSYDILSVIRQQKPCLPFLQQNSCLPFLPKRSSLLPLDQRLKRVFDIIKQKIKSEPGTYRGAIKSFVTNFENLDSDSALVSSLYTFGKSSGDTLKAAKRHKMIAWKSLRNASHLKEESTAVPAEAEAEQTQMGQ
ncbi:uncharacterized protein LOC117306861 [Asterias rubens]|uniref:uncharacterized protein LOC117306861 n=1 Tax=Asterias rubens TaxID=7604 RepID=UPI0014556BD1|nr:uncharacterized protein LOC117306861 [Asterias rubens]